MKNSWILLICAIAFSQVKAHPDPVVANDANRVDPVWTTTFEAKEFCWAYDSKVDSKGNLYVTGFYRNSMVYDHKTARTAVRCGSTCPDTYFLMKYDSSGRLLWYRQAEGTSRPASIALDDDGNVFVVGSVFSEELHFTSVAESYAKLDKPKTSGPGIFICKYDSNGTVIQSKFISDGRNEFPNAMVVDNRGDIYIAGEYKFRLAGKRDSPKRSYLLMKLNDDLEREWLLSGDTIGESLISSITVNGKREVFVSGRYDGKIEFGDELLISDGHSGGHFVAAFDSKGKLSWAKDKLAKIPAGTGQSIVCIDDHVYVAINSPYRIKSIVKMDRKGTVIWGNTIEDAQGLSLQQLIPDQKGGVYLCGEGPGGIFHSAAPNALSYKVKGHDIFLAKYAADGRLEWMKTAGGEGTDYCKSISVYNDQVYAFGWFSLGLRFREQQLTSKTGYSFYIARFNESVLASEAPDPTEMLVGRGKDLAENGSLGCECTEDSELPTGFPGSVEDLATYKNMVDMTGWTYAQGGNLYNDLFYTKLYNQHHYGEVHFQLTVLAFDPVRLLHPDGTFTLNLTPCEPQNKVRRLPTSVNYTHAILRSDPGFKVENFTGSAQDYMDVFLTLAGQRFDAVLHHLLFDYEMTEIEGFVAKLNKEYNTNIQITDQDEATVVRDIMAELRRVNVDFVEFFLYRFVTENEKPHDVTAAEFRKMGHIFSKWLGDRSKEDLDRTIYPQLGVHMDTKQVSVEVSEKVLRKWDGVRGEPAKNDAGEYQPSPAVARVDGVRYNTDTDFIVRCKSVCFPRSEITGTGILLSFSGARLITNHSRRPLNSRGQHLIHLKGDLSEIQPKAHMMGYEPFEYDSLLINFTGLDIPKARVTLPLKEGEAFADGIDLLINNDFISGHFLLPIDPENSEQIVLEASGERVFFKIEELETQLKEWGMGKIFVRPQEEFIALHFMKWVGR